MFVFLTQTANHRQISFSPPMNWNWWSLKVNSVWQKSTWYAGFKVVFCHRVSHRKKVWCDEKPGRQNFFDILCCDVFQAITPIFLSSNMIIHPLIFFLISEVIFSCPILCSLWGKMIKKALFEEKKDQKRVIYRASIFTIDFQQQGTSLNLTQKTLIFSANSKMNFRCQKIVSAKTHFAEKKNLFSDLHILQGK